MNGASPGFPRIIPLIIVLLSAWASPVFPEDIRTLTKKAEGGDAMAQYNLGIAHAFGQGVPQDYTEAVEWYRKAAEQGVQNAQYNLGVSYLNGQGVPKDYTLAAFWFSLSASGSTGEDYARRAEERDYNAKGLTPEERLKVQQMTREWEATHPRK
jgi:TPR repeat protein